MVYNEADDSIKRQYSREGTLSLSNFKEWMILFNIHALSTGFIALQGRVNVFVVKDEGHTMLSAETLK